MKQLSLPQSRLMAPGPARMIEEIDSFLETTAVTGYITVTDREQHIVAIYELHSLDDVEVPKAVDDMNLDELHRLVVLVRFPERFPTHQLKERVRGWVSALGHNSNKILDVLLVGPSHWWSAMCHDDDCCPPAGRPRINPKFEPLSHSRRKELWAKWQELLSSRATGKFAPIEDLAVLVDGLVDLRLRDSILAHAGQNPERRGAWTSLINDLLDNHNFSRNVALKTTHCALAYLQGDLAQARAIAEEALNLDGTYSLALLLHRGLVTKAPPTTLEAAFCNASIDVLINEPKKTA